MEKSLDGNWRFTDPEFSGCAVPIPGDFHSALLAAGKIPDPYWASNEQAVRWMMERAWEIETSFQVALADLTEGPVLELDRVNTLATVILNDQELGRCENVHRRYRFGNLNALKAGENILRLRFDNPVAASQALADAQPFPIPYLDWNVDLPHANLIRMVASDAGWDWNICLTPLGINGGVKLVSGRRVSLDYVRVFQTHLDDGPVQLDITLTGDCLYYDPANDVNSIQARLIIDGQSVTAPCKRSSTGFEATATLTIDAPKLWWPAGMGPQNTYDLVAEVDGQTLSKSVALRDISLDLSPDEAGASMLFAVNGDNLFAKGANWIPSDALPARRTPETTRPLLESAVAANMNMLRVWGGGQYEPDWFYDLCTELGLLIWQDCMFSCHLYPSDPDFLANVDAELAHNVQRLQHHGCIALWCGDNELVGAITWYPESQANRDRYLVNYDRLNRTVENAVKRYDPSRVFWPSSPSKGALDFGDAWHEDGSGDMHYWNVWHEAAPFEDFYKVRPRFCSEFGFQSFPSLETVKSFAPEEEWNISSPAFELHQRNDGGMDLHRFRSGGFSVMQRPIQTPLVISSPASSDASADYRSH